MRLLLHREKDCTTFVLSYSTTIFEFLEGKDKACYLLIGPFWIWLILQQSNFLFDSEVVLVMVLIVLFTAVWRELLSCCIYSVER